MKKKPSTMKDILFLSISSFIVVAAWVGFNIYHSYVTTTITPELQVQIIPINPDFDTVTLNVLKSRKTITPVSVLTAPVVQPQPAAATAPIIQQDPAPIITSPTPTIANEIPITVEGE